MIRTLLVALAASTLGALAAAPFAQAGNSVAPPQPGAWSYLCFDAQGAKEVMEKANRVGAQGWEMVAGTSRGAAGTWCFRQPSWARPADKD